MKNTVAVERIARRLDLSSRLREIKRLESVKPYLVAFVVLTTFKAGTIAYPCLVTRILYETLFIYRSGNLSGKRVSLGERELKSGT